MEEQKATEEDGGEDPITPSQQVGFRGSDHRLLGVAPSVDGKHLWSRGCFLAEFIPLAYLGRDLVAEATCFLSVPGWLAGRQHQPSGIGVEAPVPGRGTPALP